MPNQNSPSFYVLADKYGIESDIQIELLLAFAESVQPAFTHWLAEVEADLAKPVEDAPMISEADAFFDRDLACRCIPELLQLEYEDSDPATNTYFLSGKYFDLLQETLKDNKTADDEACNEILGGYYLTLPDATILIMVLDGDSVGGPYVDAVMVLPKDTPFRDAPNVSLEPRDTLVGEYCFDYPDGTTRTLKLCS